MADTSVTDKRKYLDPHVLDTIRRLELRARLVVEGYVSGMHDSPYKGYSVEFAQHREYVQGDDIRFVDWKVWAKSDRIYIKEFEEETNLRAMLFLDQSESMTYGSARTKFDYAATMAAALAYLIHNQHDSVGLTLFDEESRVTLPPSTSRAQLNTILHNLQEAKATRKTRIGDILHHVADRGGRKGLILIISDLFDDPDNILKGLTHLRHSGHDILLFHVMDRDEVEFPFERMTLFDGMEQMPELLVDPKSLRDAYLREVKEFKDKVRKGCQAQKIDYIDVVTDQSLEVVLTGYLAKRAHMLKGGRR
ncbi:MAG: DUF58 domain-containing protein [Planctomycetota bacterium]